MTVTEFCMDRMSAYALGGATYETAAHFTRGELSALLAGNHWTHGQPTPAPTTTHQGDAWGEADTVLAAIKDAYQAAPQTAIEGPTMTAETKTVFPHGEAPERPLQAHQTRPRAKQTGLEGLKKFNREKIA